MTSDIAYMRIALQLAKRAGRRGEVPVGALIVQDGRVVGRGWNLMERSYCITRHAEIVALESASRRLRSWRLEGCTVYATLEPCPMCAAALCLARVDRIVFGAADPLAGACGSVYNLPGEGRLKAKPKIAGGILAEDCSSLLKEFFQDCRRRLPQA